MGYFLQQTQHGFKLNIKICCDFFIKLQSVVFYYKWIKWLFCNALNHTMQHKNKIIFLSRWHQKINYDLFV